MKIRELLEGLTPKLTGTTKNLPARVSGPLPGTFIQKQLRNTDPYMQYRLGLAVAAAQGIAKGELDPSSIEQESEWAENLIQIAYTPEEEETIRLASKIMGVKPKKIAKSKSVETDKVNTTSPVAKKKKNKYGV
jgi:hypothetical protein